MLSSARRSMRALAASLTVTTMIAVMLSSPAAAQPASDEIRGDLEQVRVRLDELEVAANGVVDRYNAAAESLDAIRAEKAATEAEHTALAGEIRDLQDTADEHVRRLFKLGPALELASLMVTGDPSETAGRSATLRRVLVGERGDLEALAAARTSLEALAERIAEQTTAAEQRAGELEQQRSEVEAALAAQHDEVERLTASLEAAVSREEAAAREAEAARRREAAEAAQRERARAVPTATPAATSTAPASDATPKADSDGSTAAAPAARANAQVAVDAALSRLGMPYRWGATGPNSFDCSGLMVWAWRQAGVSLPRTSSGQFASLPRISRSELRPGDLVFAGSPVHHVGMYIGGGKIVHAPQTGRNVEIRSMERHDLRGFGRPG